MADPLAPIIISPAARDLCDTTQQFVFTYYHPQGKAVKGYRIRRAEATYPVPGADQWWTGAGWGGATTVLLGAPLSSGSTVETDLTTGWVNGSNYYWAIAAVDEDDAIGPYSAQRVLSSHAAPTPEILGPSGAQSSPFFRILFNWESAAGKLMRDYRFWIYSSDVYSDGSFDPSDPDWQSLAKWSMEKPLISSSDFYYDVKNFQAQPVLTYRAYGEFHDSDGLSSGFIQGPTATLDVNNMVAPVVTAQLDQTTGIVTLVTTSDYNLLPEEVSDFTDGTLADWVNVLNSNVAYSEERAFSGVGSMKMTAAGMTFDQLDAAHSDFDDEEASYTDYEEMEATQADPDGVIRAMSPGRIPVTPSTAYSLLLNVYSEISGQEGRPMIYWWQADDSPSATPVTTDPGTVLAAGAWNAAAMENVTSPADAVYASVGIEIGDAAIPGTVFFVDAVVLHQGTSVSWIGASGLAYRYVVRRTESDGSVYEVFSATQDNPYSQGGGLNVARIPDFDPPINGGPFSYEVWSVLGERPNEQWSPSTVYNVDSFTSDTWFIRSVDGVINVPLSSESRAKNVSMNDETISPDGSDYPVVLYSSSPDVIKWALNAWVLDIDSYNLLTALLVSRKKIIVQSNTHGERMYGHITGGYSDKQVRAVSIVPGQPVRPVRQVDFSLTGTGRPA